MIVRYGYQWSEDDTDLTIELAAFLIGIPVEDGGLGKAGHFRNVVDMLWNQEGSTMKFDWHPWADRMLDYSCEWQYLAVAGCASSGKTDFYALWAIVNYIADPRNTKVLVTSTSLKDSRLRIWGRIKEYWEAVPGLPGKLVDSFGVIKFIDPETGKDLENAGITLLAGDPKKEKESIGKLIGFKRRRVILVADELPELSPAILEAALGNLDSNPYFQIIGIGNPNSYYDAFGIFSEPKDGWKSISQQDEEWETNYGWCIRFDGEKSPNVLAGKVIYPYMLTQEKIDDKKKKLGANSRTYWRMMRGYWCPTGDESSIYSEADIIQYDAETRDVTWKSEPTRVAFLDTSFTHGGDRAVVYMGWCGEAVSGVTTLLYDEEPRFIHEDVTVTDEPINYQIARLFKEMCVEEKVLPENAGVDSTGGGGPFCDILAVVWSPEVYRCYFGGKATDRPVSSSDDRPGHEAYANRVSEIWYAGVELIRTRQIKGMGREFIKEAVARLYDTKKRGSGEVIEVEPKVKMKARMQKSPDIADAGFGLLDLCRERHGLTSTEKDSVETNRSNKVENEMKKMDVAGRSARHLQREGGAHSALIRPGSTGFISLKRQ